MPTMIFPGKLLILCCLLSIQSRADLPQAAQAEAPAIRWAATLDEALEQAAARRCFVILSYLGPWDATADSAATKAQAVPEIAALAQKQLFFKAYAGSDEAARRLRDRYRILTTPTFLVLSPDGQELDRIRGYREGAQLAAELQLLIDNPSAFGRLLQEEKSPGLPPEKQLLLINALRSRMNYAECLRRLPLTRNASKEWPADIRRGFLHLSAQCLLESGRPAEALAVLDALLREPAAAEGSTIQTALLRAEALIELQRLGEAAGALAALSDVPNQEVFLAAAKLRGRLPLEVFSGTEGYWEIQRQATEALSKGKISEALRVANQALEIAPFQGDTRLLLAHIQYALAEKAGNPIDRNRALEKACEELWICRRLDPWNGRTAAEVSRVLKNLVATAGSKPATPPAAPAKSTGPESAARREIPQLEAIVSALAANPDDPGAWRDLDALGHLAGTPLERHDRLVPFELLAIPQEASLEAPRLYCRAPAEARPAWREYAQVRRMYQAGKMQQLREARAVYFPTAIEELRGLEAAAQQWRSAREKDPSLRDAQLDLLCLLQSETMLEAFVFVEQYTEQLRPEFELWKQRQPGKIHEYVCRWLLRPAGGPKSPLQLSSSPCLGAALSPVDNPILQNLPAARASLESLLQRGAAPAAQTRRTQALSLFNQAVVAHRSNDFERAINLYRQSLALEPNFSPPHQNLALLYFNQGHLMQAAQHGERGALLEPGNPSLIYLATQSYIQLQLYDCAVFCIRRALQQPLEASQQATLLDRLAYAYIQIREWSRAEQTLKEALALDGENPEILQHAELLKRMRGQPKKLAPAP